MMVNRMFMPKSPQLPAFCRDHLPYLLHPAGAPLDQSACRHRSHDHHSVHHSVRPLGPSPGPKTREQARRNQRTRTRICGGKPKREIPERLQSRGLLCT